MFKLQTKVAILNDTTEVLRAAVKALEGNQVLVGVPAAEDPRQDEPIGNAMLAYIHNFGSPDQNIPARPFMYPGILDAKDEITYRMEQASGAALDGNMPAMNASLSAAGLVATTSIKNKIQSGPFEPLKPATLAARRRRGFAGTLALNVTGQLRNSITYVLRRIS